MPQTPLISVIIATHNRPGPLARLLSSVKEQNFVFFECIVIDDASSEDTLAKYEEIFSILDDRFTLHCRPSQGGPSGARNSGIALAKGKYVAFCDDDDVWIRPDHLAVAARSMEITNADVFFACVQMSSGGTVYRKNNNEFLSKIITNNNEKYINEDVYIVRKISIISALKHYQLIHANTLVLNKNFLRDTGVYWEKISFAEDLEISMRILDRAKIILFRNVIVSDYDTTPHSSAFGRVAAHERPLFGVIATMHAEYSMLSPHFRRIARSTRAWYLLELAQLCIAGGSCRQGLEWTMQSLRTKFTRKALIMVFEITKNIITKNFYR